MNADVDGAVGLENTAYEDALLWRGQRIEIGTLVEDSAPLGRLPGALASYLELSQRHVLFFGADLDSECTRGIAEDLVESFWARARELEQRGALGCTLPADVFRFTENRSPREVVHVLATVIAAGLRYDHHAVLQKDTSWLARLRWLARSAWELRGSFAVRAAKRAVANGGSPALCSHYAAAATTLFFALKKITDEPSRAVVMNIVGEAYQLADDQHAWNWLVDLERGELLAFDISAMRPSSSGVLERKLEPARVRNVSGLLATAIYRASAGLVEAADCAELLAATIDPRTDRGNVLLFHIADNLVVDIALRDRIAEHLEAHDFDRLVPGWRVRLDHRTASLGAVGRRLFASGAHAASADVLAHLMLDRSTRSQGP